MSVKGGGEIRLGLGFCSILANFARLGNIKPEIDSVNIFKKYPQAITPLRDRLIVTYLLHSN